MESCVDAVHEFVDDSDDEDGDDPVPEGKDGNAGDGFDAGKYGCQDGWCFRSGEQGECSFDEEVEHEDHAGKTCSDADVAEHAEDTRDFPRDLVHELNTELGAVEDEEFSLHVEACAVFEEEEVEYCVENDREDEIVIHCLGLRLFYGAEGEASTLSATDFALKDFRIFCFAFRFAFSADEDVAEDAFGCFRESDHGCLFCLFDDFLVEDDPEDDLASFFDLVFEFFRDVDVECFVVFRVHDRGFSVVDGEDLCVFLFDDGDLDIVVRGAEFDAFLSVDDADRFDAAFCRAVFACF